MTMEFSSLVVALGMAAASVVVMSVIAGLAFVLRKH